MLYKQLRSISRIAIIIKSYCFSLGLSNFLSLISLNQTAARTTLSRSISLAWPTPPLYVNSKYRTPLTGKLPDGVVIVLSWGKATKVLDVTVLLDRTTVFWPGMARYAVIEVVPVLVARLADADSL